MVVSSNKNTNPLDFNIKGVQTKQIKEFKYLIEDVSVKLEAGLHK